MAGSFGCAERSNACGVKVLCLGRRSRPDRVGASRYRSPRAALLSHRERQEAERLTAGDSWQESSLVFTTSVGTVVEPRNLPRIFEHLVQRSGVRRIRFHDYGTHVRRCFWRRVSRPAW
jgi:hypothetical protein